MLYSQHMLCEVFSFSSRTKLPLIPSRNVFLFLLFVDVGQFFVFLLLSQPPSSTHRTHQGKKKGDEKATEWADHWSMTQLWKSLPSNQIVRLQGVKVPQSCPRPLSVTGELWGVNAHFSQLSRTCDGGKRNTEERRGHHTHKLSKRVPEILNCAREEAGNTNFPVVSHLSFPWNEIISGSKSGIRLTGDSCHVEKPVHWFIDHFVTSFL